MERKKYYAEKEHLGTAHKDKLQVCGAIILHYGSISPIEIYVMKHLHDMSVCLGQWGKDFLLFHYIQHDQIIL